MTPVVQPSVNPLVASCYASSPSIFVGNSAQWYSSVSGGPSSYNISWSGDEGLGGYGSSISKVYSIAGTKTASIVVTSGNQSVSANCSGVINVTNVASPIVNPLVASCYSSKVSSLVGDSVQWYTSISGGGSSYNITWTGDEGLSGYGSSIAKVYTIPGTKNASIVVTSGGQSVSANCSGAVNVSNIASNVIYPATTYVAPTYYPTNYYSSGYNNYYSAISASCSANTSYTSAGSYVTWTASAYGGNGYYTYSWGGTDGLYGANQSVSFTYNNPGSKTAYVTVYSNGQSAIAYCTNTVTVSGTNYVNNGYIAQNNVASLDIGCYADPISSAVNQPITWNAEVTGGVAPYTYSWSGSDSLSGTQSSLVKYYSTTGEKNAVVTVRSANGLTGTRACSNIATIRTAGSQTVRYVYVNTANNGTVSGTSTSAATTTAQNNGQLAASSIFSFDNVPWGWIAILIILV